MKVIDFYEQFHILTFRFLRRYFPSYLGVENTASSFDIAIFVALNLISILHLTSILFDIEIDLGSIEEPHDFVIVLVLFSPFYYYFGKLRHDKIHSKHRNVSTRSKYLIMSYISATMLGFVLIVLFA